MINKFREYKENVKLYGRGWSYITAALFPAVLMLMIGLFAVLLPITMKLTSTNSIKVNRTTFILKENGGIKIIRDK
jgi:hypothetical protein